MAPRFRIRPVSADEMDALVPMIGDYQRFYRVEEIDPERNRAFFSRFLHPSDEGMLLGAWDGDRLLGYACLYWTFNSFVPGEKVLMNDLYVDEEVRGQGVGRALIEAAADVGRERGANRLEWSTEPGNVTAQRLYDTTGAERSEWVEYTLDL